MSTPTRFDARAAPGSKSDPHTSIRAENRWRNSLSLHLVVPLSTDLPPPKGTPTRAETETRTDPVPEDLLSGPLVDVPDAVRGDFREPGGGRGGRERPTRPPGDDRRPRRQGGPTLGLVQPRRNRTAYAHLVSSTRRSDS